MNTITLKPIGIICTPFGQPEETPIQPRRAGGAEGTVDIYPEFVEGLDDLDGFSHLILLFHFHLCEGYKLKVVPYLDAHQRGLFATRAPRRPNPIGLSVVRLDRIEDGRLYIRDVDMLNGTPLLDIKPYVPEFDVVSDFKTGWLENLAGRASDTEADDRFHR